MHETIPRRFTQADSVSRILSYATEIAVPLCRECNLLADDSEIRKVLLDECREKWGPIVDALIWAIGQRIGISLAEYIETEKENNNDN